jgi:cellulose synthase/poly-beta-1,6-N-acetylglucosamine synthase-like glycosyltransferase
MNSFDSEQFVDQATVAADLLNGFAEDLNTAIVEAPKTGVVERIRSLRFESASRLSDCINRLRRLGIDDQTISASLKRAELTGSWFVHELLSGGQLSAQAYYRQLAADLGLEYASAVDVRRIVKEATAPVFRVGRSAQVCCREKDGRLVIYVAPDSISETVISDTIKRFPAKKSTFRIVIPSTIQDALAKLHSAQAAQVAASKLYLQTPQMSAKFTMVSWQAFSLGVFTAIVPTAFLLRPWETFAIFHSLVTLAFALTIATRLAAFLGLRSKKKGPRPVDQNEARFPIYSVLVALHKEAAVAPQIVRSMSRLDWPQSRLEVIYVCEEDDKETQEALRRNRMPTSHRILSVPPLAPRTKPKALNFALEQCSGELVVIYDAEDRPDPLQLREAWQRFSVNGPELACLQAPLLVTNAHQSWLSCLFAVEYASHFQALLPFLDLHGAPLPLGGTSNHFRREALEKVGGWDPYNVTEDADLGIRFARNGYRCSMIARPTLEDGPTTLSEWIPQRTRWIKGWMQTFLVHNRDLKQLYRNIRWKNLLLFEILMVSFIFSPLLYLISIISFVLIYIIVTPNYGVFFEMYKFDLLVFLGGHLSHVLLSAAAWREAFKSRIPIAAALTFPAYWTLGTYAAWRAVWKLIRAPFEWEKTNHRPASPQTTGGSNNARRSLDA